jgi:hypothetical protein
VGFPLPRFISKRGFMIIALGVPVGEVITPQTCSTIATIAYFCGTRKDEFHYFSEKSAYVDGNANAVFKRAQKVGADYLFMIETDLENASGGDVLYHMIGLGADVVSGIYYRGSYPYRPILHGYTDNLGELQFPGEWPETEPFFMDSVGSGFLLISKKVMDAFTPEKIAEIGEPFDYLIKDNKIVWRNDLAFCYRMKQLGFKILVDPRIALNHIKMQPITGAHWKASRQRMIETNKVIV